eukprot:scaffold40386_cov65-Phaeocystis_antarctica.AAC.2
MTRPSHPRKSSRAPPSNGRRDQIRAPLAARHLGPAWEARAAPPPASCLELFRRREAALRQAAAALPHTWCACRAAIRQRVPVKHAADRRLRGRKVIGLPARARHDERRAPPWPVRSRAYHLKVPRQRWGPMGCALGHRSSSVRRTGTIYGGSDTSHELSFEPSHQRGHQTKLK